jgi:cell division protein ZapE
MAGMKVYLTPLGPETDRAMDEDWRKLTDEDRGTPMELTVLGRKLAVPQAAGGVARFSFADLCAAALGAADYLAIAETFRTVMVDRIPVMGPEMRNEARRFVLLIDTLYDEGVKLICSAAAPPEALYTDGDGAEAFRRTASRLAEMQSADYLARGHRIEMPNADID